MQEDEHSQEESETEPNQVTFQEEEIRISSSGSSPNIEESKVNSTSHTNQFQLFDQFITAKTQQKAVVHIAEKEHPKYSEQPQQPQRKAGAVTSVIEQVQKQWIIKNAQMQRIGGTYDFFIVHLDRYKRHLQARKIVLCNITALIDKGKITRAHPIMILKEYFKEYASICSDFHEHSYKYTPQQREESDNKMANIKVDLKSGFEKLFALRKQTGNELSRLEKFMKTTIVAKIDKAIEVYWGVMAGHQSKAIAKREIFEQREKKFQKRVQKISKVYGKGRLGSEIDEDVFQQMVKFVKEERELRYSIYDWGKELLNLRKNTMGSDYNLFIELQGILGEYKHFNDTVYQLQKKKFKFADRLKDNIQNNFQFEKLCTPLDNDYIMSVLNFKNKSTVSLLKQQDYEYFLNEEYFAEIIGDTSEFLKGTIAKSFPLKNPDQQLVKSVSGNLVHYNKRTLQVKYRAKIANTTANFEGYGCVSLKEIVKGIIFDSEHAEKVYFKDDNRAQELIFFLSGEFEAQ